MSSNNPIIVALDVENAAEARRIVNAVGDAASFYKVGLELYASAGIEIVRELKGQGKRVFLDLKLYDIGETVKRAVVQIAKSGADYLTIHAMRQVMQAAVAGRGDSAMKLLGVTVLTSVDDRVGTGGSTGSQCNGGRRRGNRVFGLGCRAGPPDLRRGHSGDPRSAVVRRCHRRPEAGSDPRPGDRRRRRSSGDRKTSDTLVRSARRSAEGPGRNLRRPRRELSRHA
jgi:orotidine 5'-phosphate decarboxylase subfamily 1